jgi:hypothetical protein
MRGPSRTKHYKPPSNRGAKRREPAAAVQPDNVALSGARALEGKPFQGSAVSISGEPAKQCHE